ENEFFIPSGTGSPRMKPIVLQLFCATALVVLDGSLLAGEIDPPAGREHVSRTSEGEIVSSADFATDAIDPDASFDNIGPTKSSFMARWNAISGATGYRLDVSTSSSFSDYVAGYEGLRVGPATTSWVVTRLAPGTTYYYRVNASDVAGDSTSAEIKSATTAAG